MAASVTGSVKVRVARSFRDSGVFITHPKWDESPSLFSCDMAEVDNYENIIECLVFSQKFKVLDLFKSLFLIYSNFE